MTEVELRVQKIFATSTEAEKAEVKKAAELIRAGKLVAFPTETVYGLGANALDENAVHRTYEAKGRPSDNPLILHVSSIKMAEQIVFINDMAKLLMEKFWPGPLTLVLPAKDIVPHATRGGLETAAVRMPDNRIALELIHYSDLPLSAPSANRSGRPSPTDAATVREDLGEAVDMILDGGETKIGVESTVLDVTGNSPVLLRAGGLSKEEIERSINMKVLLPQDQNIIKRSPGTRYRHYAPRLPVELSAPQDAAKIAKKRKFAWMGISKPRGEAVRELIFKDETEYAHEVFRALRQLENCGAELIIAEMPKDGGIGRALKDRLIRASGV